MIEKSKQQLEQERLYIELEKSVRFIIEEKFNPNFSDIKGGLQNVVTFIAMAVQFVDMSVKGKVNNMKIGDLGIKVPFVKGDAEGERFNKMFDDCKDIKVGEFNNAINVFTSRLQKHLLKIGLKKDLKEYDLEKILEEKTS
jgi:hypothetical protein